MTLPADRTDGRLPRLVIVGGDSAAIRSIDVIVGDLCRIEERHEALSFEDDDASLLPALTLVEFNTLASDPRVLRQRLLSECRVGTIPAFFVCIAGRLSCDDGFPLTHCLVTPSRPTELRAVIESRLPRRVEVLCGWNRYVA